MDPRYNEIGPGFWGFVATFALALALIVLGWSLNKHLRKVRLEAAAAEKAALVGVEDRDRGGDVVADESTDS